MGNWWCDILRNRIGISWLFALVYVCAWWNLYAIFCVTGKGLQMARSILVTGIKMYHLYNCMRIFDRHDCKYLVGLAGLGL